MISGNFGKRKQKGTLFEFSLFFISIPRKIAARTYGNLSHFRYYASLFSLLSLVVHLSSFFFISQVHLDNPREKMEDPLNLIIKWNSKEYKVNLSKSNTVLDLKQEILKQTGVKPERQKLLNLKSAGKVLSLLYFYNHACIFYGQNWEKNIINTYW